MKLLIYLLLYSTTTFATGEIVLKDTFIFKIMGGNIISISDIEADLDKLRVLDCYYPNSLVMDVFESFYRRGQKLDFDQLYNQDRPFKENQTVFFKQAVPFYKMKAYISTQRVETNSKFNKGLYLVGRKNKCEMSLFDENQKVEASYLDIFKIELFFRARFIPEQRGIVTAELLKAAKTNVELFVESVTKQIEDKVLWK